MFGYQCPICGTEYRRIEGRFQCPNCIEKQRERIVLAFDKFLSELVSDNPIRNPWAPCFVVASPAGLAIHFSLKGAVERIPRDQHRLAYSKTLLTSISWHPTETHGSIVNIMNYIQVLKDHGSGSYDWHVTLAWYAYQHRVEQVIMSALPVLCFCTWRSFLPLL